MVHRAFGAPFAARSAGAGTAVLALMFYAGPGETQHSTVYSSFAPILPVKHGCLCKSNEKGKKTRFAYQGMGANPVWDGFGVGSVGRFGSDENRAQG